MWLSLFLFVYNASNGVGAVVVGQCCRKRGVTETCTRMLCNPQNPPNDFDVYNIFERKLNCQPYMNAISECLADGRDHIHCCMSEAKDRDENACFGMCRGEGIDGIAAWDKYQTCLAINLQSMFRCFERGYMNIPTSPLSLHIVSKSTDSVVLSWSPPAVNSNLAESYQVICKEGDSGFIEKTINTRNYKATLTGLHADSKYSVHVIALTRDGRHRSLPSETVNFYTAGAAPQVTAYRETVSIPGDASSVTIACRMEMSGTVHKSAYFEWKKMQEKTGHYEKIAATPIPPEPPYTCCQRLGIRSPCVAVCGSEFGKRAALRAESFINSHCEDEISKFLTCTTAGVDEGACCLRKKVPGICLPLCDGFQMNKLDTIPHACAVYTFSIFQCRMENADSRPATVSGLKAIPNPDGDLLLRWDLTPRADMYHVYWKRKFSTTWELSSVVTTSKRIYGNIANDIDEIVVVASNSFGNAHPARLIHNDDKWTASYHFQF